MLVLSRGPQDQVVFPNLGITVEIMRISGNKVRVGIEAPDDVRVLRHELVDPADVETPKARERGGAADSHEVRNRLNTAHIALGLAEKQINAGLSERALETLRCAISQFDCLDAALGPADSDAKPSPEPDKPRALLVEDDRNESQLLAAFLRLSGFEVDTAEDGLKAMIYLGQYHRPDVVLMDMHMPHMDGANTVRSIRSNPELADMRLFAVTGSDPSEFPITIGPDGVDDWFRKPVNPQALAESIHRTLSERPSGRAVTTG